jgi:hypothetical protein
VIHWIQTFGTTWEGECACQLSCEQKHTWNIARDTFRGWHYDRIGVPSALQKARQVHDIGTNYMMSPRHMQVLASGCFLWPVAAEHCSEALLATAAEHCCCC